MLTQDQERGLEVLLSGKNVFLTGDAGTGKSFLIKQFLRKNPGRTCLVASTGTAAILIGGRTIHSFFGIGIISGGVTEAVQRALSDGRVAHRVKKMDTLIIDEISMLNGSVLEACDLICKKVRSNSAPWGGVQVVVVGDFYQLPPIPEYGVRDWAFNSVAWGGSNFEPVVLAEVVRTKDLHFINVLKDVRRGVLTQEVHEFLRHRLVSVPPEDSSVLLPKRKEVNQHNYAKLNALPGDPTYLQTAYTGKPRDIESLKNRMPIPDVLSLKKGALVMVRINDLENGYSNGSMGHVRSCADGGVTVELVSGHEVWLPPHTFQMLDADGNVAATATNVPLVLAWAITIHKAQGATLDAVCADLTSLWEPGQAYVALSRAKTADGLTVLGWSNTSIHGSLEVGDFYQSLRG